MTSDPKSIRYAYAVGVVPNYTHIISKVLTPRMRKQMRDYGIKVVHPIWCYDFARCMEVRTPLCTLSIVVWLSLVPCHPPTSAGVNIARYVFETFSWPRLSKYINCHCD